MLEANLVHVTISGHSRMGRGPYQDVCRTAGEVDHLPCKFSFSDVKNRRAFPSHAGVFSMIWQMQDNFSVLIVVNIAL